MAQGMAQRKGALRTSPGNAICAPMFKQILILGAIVMSLSSCDDDDDSSCTDSCDAGQNMDDAGDTPVDAAPDAPDTRTNLEIYCAGNCVSDPECLTDPRDRCWAAASNRDDLLRLEACVADGECNWTDCVESSEARTAYVEACVMKATECGGTAGGMRPTDCDDAITTVRDELFVQFTACFSEECDNIADCLTTAIQTAEPVECAEL